MPEQAHAAAKPCRSWFVTGTDTNVGKTLFSAALLHNLARQYPQRYRHVVGMKPVAAGSVWREGQEVYEDVLALRQASTCRVPQELDSPVRLPHALSPHIAAARAGVAIDLAHLQRSHRQLMALADAVVVEGAGGFCVPLSQHTSGADLALALGLPVLLVVGMRLGCLNHALLTAQAITARGLVLAGWVANHIDPNMQAQEENAAYLQTQLQAPCLGRIAWQTQPDASRIQLDLPPTWGQELA